MTKLYDPTKHEPVTDKPFREAEIRAAVDRLRTEAEMADQGDQFWREHPLELDKVADPTGFLSSFYYGAAGTLWALRELGSSPWHPERADVLWEANRACPDAGSKRPGLFLGDLGVALVAWRLSEKKRYLDLAYDAALKTIPEPELELLWAAPGAVLVARHIADETGEDRWQQIGRTGADHLLSHWKMQEGGLRLWTQDLYGMVRQYQGAGHGFAGNAGALLAALPWLAETTVAEILQDIAETTLRLAAREDGLSNWQALVQDSKPAGPYLVQWCHGAPGFITALARYPVGHAPELEQVLLEAGELIWQAGPLKKPFGLCHGTAGNAYAFLVLFQRTKNELWFDRAKKFAVHAIQQSEQALVQYGRRRWSFHTGDLGLAVFLSDLLSGDGNLYPGVNRF